MVILREVQMVSLFFCFVKRDAGKRGAILFLMIS